MRQGKSFGNRLDFWKVRSWGKHQAEHDLAYTIRIFADTRDFQRAIEQVVLALRPASLDTP